MDRRRGRGLGVFVHRGVGDVVEDDAVAPRVGAGEAFFAEGDLTLAVFLGGDLEGSGFGRRYALSPSDE